MTLFCVSLTQVSKCVKKAFHENETFCETNEAGVFRDWSDYFERSKQRKIFPLMLVPNLEALSKKLTTIEFDEC